MTPDLIIFDCDGVLIESEIIACQIEAEALTEEGYPIDAAGVAERFMGRPTSAMQKIVEEALGRPLREGFIAEMDRKILLGYRDRVEAGSGVADLVRSLSVPYCVASSSSPPKLFTGLTESGLLELFYPSVFSTVLVKQGKPAPDLFLYAAAHMAQEPANTVVIEDSVAGVSAGLAAGMRVIGFHGGAHCGPGHAAMLQEAGAHAVTDRHASVPQILATL